MTKAERDRFDALEARVGRLESLLFGAYQQRTVVDSAIHAAASFYGVAPELVRSRSHRKECVEPRRMAIWIIRESRGEWTLQRIAQEFLQHHTTVLAALERFARDPVERREYAARIVAEIGMAKN